ncbi:integral peroxisomal membrane peroxin-domain-containing protein [Schizophyllum fasciatum]
MSNDFYNPNAPALLDFLSSVPWPLTSVLVGLSPIIARVRGAVEITSWRTSWYDSWLAIAAWWALCLFADTTLRYLLPVALVLVLLLARWTGRPLPNSPPITEQTLQAVIADLTTIHALLPAAPPVRITPNVVVRVCALSYLPYLWLTYFIPLRLLLGVLGSVVLCVRAPWAAILGKQLWKSAWVRWTCYTVWARLSGQRLPPLRLSATQLSEAMPEPTDSRRILFTVLENQRWWMGLDWTAALLPNERPSWSSPAATGFQPADPPSIFPLPAPSVVYLPDGKGGRLRRTAIWSWDDPEWTVVVRTEGGPARHVRRPLPVPEGENSGLLMRAAGMMKESSTLQQLNSPVATSSDGGDAQTVDSEHDHLAEDELPTDPDGWIYGDNKWESQSAKGGLRKYTRFRRWQRVAIVHEIVEAAEPGPLGVAHESGPEDAAPTPRAASPHAREKAPSLSPGRATKGLPTVASTNSAPTPALEIKTTPPDTHDVKPDKVDKVTSASPVSEIPARNNTSTESPLRQRLRNAIHRAAPSMGGGLGG